MPDVSTSIPTPSAPPPAARRRSRSRAAGGKVAAAGAAADGTTTATGTAAGAFRASGAGRGRRRPAPTTPSGKLAVHHETIARLAAARASLGVIARTVRSDRSTVRLYLATHGLRPPLAPRGAATMKALEAKARRILQRLGEDATPAEIATELGVRLALLEAFLRRRGWATQYLRPVLDDHHHTIARMITASATPAEIAAHLRSTPGAIRTYMGRKKLARASLARGTARATERLDAERAWIVRTLAAGEVAAPMMAARLQVPLSAFYSYVRGHGVMPTGTRFSIVALHLPYIARQVAAGFTALQIAEAIGAPLRSVRPKVRAALAAQVRAA